MKQINGLFYLIGSFIYLEVVIGIILSYMGIMPVFFGFLSAITLYLFIAILPGKFRRVINGLFLFIICFFFSAQLCIYSLFGFFFDFGVFSLANQVGAFYKETIDLILSNGIKIIILFVPFIIYLFIYKKINFEKIENFKLTTILLILLCYLFFIAPVENETTENIIRNNGIIYTFINDFKQKDEVVLVVEEIPVEEEIIVEEEKVIFAHSYDIDFEEAASKNNTIQNLNDYFSSTVPTYSNDYTGIFEGKNLVLILGESFNSLGIREDITPTLYKLKNNSFSFSNYYSPSYNSTVGGEFQLLNSAYAKSDILGIWKSGTNAFPYSLPNLFKNVGYSIRAYHDNTYSYMDRSSYLKAYGFDNYMGCGNGLEKKMNCNMWPESDADMMKATMEDWIYDEHFLAYYVTVSGHGPYTLNKSRSDIGYKYYDFLKSKGYDYSDSVMAYFSSMVEFDKMMEILIDGLRKEGKLEDTVIVVVGDHYPYFLEDPQYREILGESIDMKFDSNRNDLIIYNAGCEKIYSDKVCGTMDVLPTLYNLFNIDYDSRLMAGKDIFSNYPGLIFFGDGSWISDYGTYSAGSFKKNEGVEISEDYVSNTKAIANGRMSLTSRIFSSDYYRYIDKYKK